MLGHRIPNEENVAVHVQAHLGPVTNSCRQVKVTKYLLIHKVATKESMTNPRREFSLILIVLN